MKSEEKDSLILTAVLTASETYVVVRGAFVATDMDENVCCCAVGAGLLYAGISREAFQDGDACHTFAEHYDVSHNYAVGLSDGFEGAIGKTESSTLYRRDDDYDRGFSVGEAIAREVL